MDSNNIKILKFIYQTNEYLIDVAQSASLENLLEQVKIHFNIQSDTNLALINMDTNNPR